MPTAQFLELNDEKKQTIITAGLSEFADYGFENSSTNRIVKRAGISKGSLFKYFPTKEDFYFYILDKITAELISDLKEEVNSLPTELCQRIIEYSVLEFSWYIQYPEKSKMIIKAFAKSGTEIYKKTLSKYGAKEQDLYYWFMKDVDTTQFRWDRQKTFEIIKWFLKGFNEDFLSQIQIQSNSDFETIRQEYTASLSEHLEMLKTGLGK